MNSRQTLAYAAIGAVSLASMGCENDALIGEAVPNQPPDTEVISTPPNLLRTSFEVDFFWTGSDSDGRVVGFEWRISRNGRDGIVDVADTLQSTLPWRFTTRTDTVFVVEADLDSLDADVNDPELFPGRYRFWQTHTLFLRAVDDEGARDPTPASVSFTATTLAPTVEIDVPNYRPTITCERASRVLTFGWTGRDPDHDDGTPAESRYLLIPVTRETPGCLTRGEFEALQPVRADDPRWSDWRPYDEADGRIARFPRYDSGLQFLFAVQVRDVAGAVTPLFEWGENIRYVEITDQRYPVLTLASNLTETRIVSGPPPVRVQEVLQGESALFSWNAQATDYAGLIDGYRYGWNVQDVSDPDDPGWEIPWGLGEHWTRSTPRVLSGGSPRFVVMCRDNSGAISGAIVQFFVASVDREAQRSLLLVDDYPLGNSDLDFEWARTWENYFQGRVRGFSAGDHLDLSTSPGALSLGTLASYRSVVWFTAPGVGTYLHRNFAPSPTGEFRRNWLDLHQRFSGNLLLCGPGASYSGIERAGNEGGPNWLFPVIFDVPAQGDLGFGTAQRPDGTTYNVGTTRWPYTSWCLESTDLVRPGQHRVFGEAQGRVLRDVDCDALAMARVSERFRERYPDSEGLVIDLNPAEPRREGHRDWGLQWEEFYNTNRTTRPVTLILRSCQTPMFELRARRDLGLASDPASCPYDELETSILDGAPVGIASHVYQERKPTPGTEDFLWGFNPLSFEFDGVRRALTWIARERWQLPWTGDSR